MRIRLINFRCYTDETFDFGDSGLALLSGSSGQGKSTILIAIHFALFGTGTKVTAFGKTSCKVELEFDGMKIVRTKKPNRLVLNDVYEDESAQEVINKKFGDTFGVTGYISQNALNSFILMSPIEKLGFLEKFAFRDVDLNQIKGRCKAYISKLHDELLSTVSQLDMAKHVLSELNIPNEISFPIKCSQNNREKAIKNENIRFKNSITLIKRAKSIKEKTEAEINALKLLEVTLQARQELLDNINKKIKELAKDEYSMLYEGDDSLMKYEKRLESILALRELNIIKDQYDSDIKKLEDMKNQEKTILNTQLDDVISSLWQDYTRESLISTMKDLQKCVVDMEKVGFLRKEIKKCTIDPEKLAEKKAELEGYQAELEKRQRLYDKLKMQQELYKCPTCMTKLRVINNKLILAEDENIDVNLDTLKEEIISLKQHILKLQRLVPEEENKLTNKIESEKELNRILSNYEEEPSIQSLKEDLEYLHEYQASQLELEKKKKNIETSIKQELFSSSYNTFKQGTDKMKITIEKLQAKNKNVDNNMDEETIRLKIIEQKQNKEKLKNYTKTMNELMKERDNTLNILETAKKHHISVYEKISDEDELELIVKDQEKQIEEQELKRNEYERNIKQIEEWQRYQKEMENYHSWEMKVDILEKKEKEDRNQYASATMLKDKILEAESAAMLNIIESINTHARVYLDCFFPDNPISIQLQSFKETKKSTKPSINIEIEYKGMECDLNMLSGGELSRVILAYTLSLAEMFNTPLLLLDECTASLDQDLTSVVFNGIREHFNGKLSLIVAHQCVTAVFDKIIDLSAEKHTCEAHS